MPKCSPFITGRSLTEKSWAEHPSARKVRNKTVETHRPSRILRDSSIAADPKFDSIEDVLKDVRAGRIVIVTDDADRENEGDLIMAAERITPQAFNFMATHGRGLICAPITEERAEELGLQRMVLDNRESYRTDFTVSVDAARDISTGIS